MKHLGDITKIHGNEIDAVDCITGGSPCQDLSIAGKREGLAGNRSGLFTEMIRIIKELRERDIKDGRTDYDIRPRFVIWENVPGAFSSNKGTDFGCVLEEFARIKEPSVTIPRPTDRKGRIKWKPAGCIVGNSWSIAWRTLDAQFWGVPQRRKRISLVADFGGTTAPEILFERESLSRDTTKSREEREGTTTNAERCLNPTSYTLKIRGGVERNNAGKKAGKGPLVQTELSATLGISQDQTLIAFDSKDNQPVCYGISSYDSNAMKSSNPHSGIYEAETTRTLDNNGGNPACNQGGMAVVSMATKQLSQSVGDNVAIPICANDYKEPQVVCVEGNGSRPSHQGDGWHEGDPMYTLNSTEHHAVAVENHPADSRVKISEDGKVQTLSGRMGTGGNNVPMVMEPVCISNGQAHIASHLIEGVSQTLNCMHDPMAIIQGINGNVAGTLDASYYKGCEERQGVEREVVAYGLDRATFNQGSNAKYGFSIEEEKIGARVAKGPGAVCQSVVRRLTPLECERLQGFPDNWTDIGEWTDTKGKLHKPSDSARYKALGNSIALPQWQWIIDRMAYYLPQGATLGSLFDGIGGFPLCWQRTHGNGTAVWASEVEEFCIAVTNKRFNGK